MEGHAHDFQDVRRIMSCEDCPIGQELAERRRQRNTELYAILALIGVVFVFFFVLGLVQKNRQQVERLGFEPL